MRGYPHAQRRDLLFVSPAVILSYIARPRGWPIKPGFGLIGTFAFVFLSVISARACFLMVLEKRTEANAAIPSENGRTEQP
jgi:hypothetical protein